MFLAVGIGALAAGFGAGLLAGWSFCRGRSLSPEDSTGAPVVRWVVDPGQWPWSDAEIKLVAQEWVTEGVERGAVTEV